MANCIDKTLAADNTPHLLVTAGAAGANVRVTGAPYLGGSDMTTTGTPPVPVKAYPATTDTQLALGSDEKLYGMNLSTSGGDVAVHVLITNGVAV